MFGNRDIISIRDLGKREMLGILRLARELKAVPEPELLKGKILATLFFEPSTRTRLSFETAMARLGGSCVGFADPATSSATKGETLADTVRIIGQYADVIALRHPLDGAARAAAEATPKPIINAGDGANQHPTQSLLDLFTIQETQGRLERLSIALVGDLKYGRTVHSLIQAFLHFKPKLFLVSPPELGLPAAFLAELKHNKIAHSIHTSLEDVIRKTDVLYMTRIQKERFKDAYEYERLKNSYELTLKKLKGVRTNFRILHPLPRVHEIHPEVDATTHAAYFQQAENGLYVRQALLALVLGAKTI